MTECRKCRVELSWKQPYHKGDLPVNMDGTMHSCKGTLFQNLESWKKKWDTEYRFKVPIWCNMCHKHYKRELICSHLREDGFIEGIDTVEFYSDKYTAVKRRALIKFKKKEKDIKAKSTKHI